MTVKIKPGETVRIELAETDVAFEVSSDSEENPGAIVVSVVSVVSEVKGLLDSTGRTGELYREATWRPKENSG